MKIRELMVSGAIAFFLSTAAYSAPACDDEVSLLQQLDIAGVSSEVVTLSHDVQFISDYHKGLGVAFPDGVEPAAFLFAVGPAGVFLALIGADGCLVGSGAISLEQHAHAMKFAREAAAGI